MKDVLQEITRLCEERNWTNYELAKRSDLQPSTISTWYSKKQTPQLKTIEKVCKGFGITMSQFFAEGPDPISLTEEQKEMLDNWSALTEKQQKLFLELFREIK